MGKTLRAPLGPALLLLASLTALPAPGAPAAPSDGDALVDATEVVPGLVLDIRYATANNFLRRKLYDAPRCLLRPAVARRLAEAQRALAARGFRLKAFDCYRPLSVQKVMWEAMPVRGLVAPPSLGGSNHNRGAAVDVGLVALDGSPVELPTDHDDFSKAAHARSPLPSPAARRHRTVLQEAMVGAGFKIIRLEWWHFDDPQARRYPALDLPLSSSPAPQ